MSLTNVIFLLLGVATGQEMDRGKKFFNVREKQKFYVELEKIDILKTSQGKLKLFDTVI